MKLAQFIKDTNLTHAEFARRIGVSQVAVTRYVRGERVPRPAEMRSIVRETDGQVTPNDFLDDDAPHPSKSEVAA